MSDDEKLTQFWKTLAISAVTACAGYIGGSAPIAWRDLVTLDQLKNNSPWMAERELVNKRTSDLEHSVAGNAASLHALEGTISRLDGNVQTLLYMLRQADLGPPPAGPPK